MKPIDYREENAYEPILLTHDKPVTIDVEKGAWFKIGVSVQNPTDTDKIVSVEVKGIQVRIE